MRLQTEVLKGKKRSVQALALPHYILLRLRLRKQGQYEAPVLQEVACHSKQVLRSLKVKFTERVEVLHITSLDLPVILSVPLTHLPPSSQSIPGKEWGRGR